MNIELGEEAGRLYKTDDWINWFQPEPEGIFFVGPIPEEDPSPSGIPPPTPGGSCPALLKRRALFANGSFP